MDKENAERIAEKARNSIGEFCIKECRSYCCRKGYLVLTEKELELVLNGKKEYEKAVKKLKDGKFSLDLSFNNRCPCLEEDFKCTIYSKKERPRVCKQFPLFVNEDSIILSNRCLAVKNGLFFPYVKELLASGYKIYEGDEMKNSEFSHIIDEIDENNTQ